MSSSGRLVDFQRIRSALHSASYTGGSTHGFYLYPARFSPEIAHAIIDTFSKRGDWVLDPFMGGGTAIIEGLSLGRSMIGVDLNALAHFVARARTTPLSAQDHTHVREWAARVSAGASTPTPARDRVDNLPATVRSFIAAGLREIACLPFPRQKTFARCVLLRLGQWALDCRDLEVPRRVQLAAKLPELTKQMLVGLQHFVKDCRFAGLKKNEIVARRLLMHRSAVDLDQDARTQHLKGYVRLVFTSPPYPRVHVLYHRWQVCGRRETSAPYWIAQVPDGFYASHYTGGSRTPTGERRYFSMVKAAFSSARELLRPDALVVQLVGFADVESQLPEYMTAMNEAGYEPWSHPQARGHHLRRSVPNRKWYAKLQGAVDASSELLLFHRPRQLH